MTEEDFGENPNDVEVLNDSIDKEDDKKVSKPKKTIEIKIDELEDFLSEVNRLSTIINKTSEGMNDIVKHTNIVSNLQQIADMDLLKFQEKFANAIQNLDLQKYARDAIENSLAPLVSEYKDSNELLKNLIFELEKRHIPEKKKSSKVKMFSIAGISLLLVGALGYFLYIDNYIVEAQNNRIKIMVPAGNRVLKIDENRYVSSKNDMSFEAIQKGSFYEFEFRGAKYKVKKSSVIKG